MNTLNIIAMICNLVTPTLVIYDELKKYVKRRRYKEYRNKHNFIRSICRLYHMDRFDYFHHHIVNHVTENELDWLNIEHIL